MHISAFSFNSSTTKRIADIRMCTCTCNMHPELKVHHIVIIVPEPEHILVCLCCVILFLVYLFIFFYFLVNSNYVVPCICRVCKLAWWLYCQGTDNISYWEMSQKAFSMLNKSVFEKLTSHIGTWCLVVTIFASLPRWLRLGIGIC